MQYRSEIDGLRALAVLPVIFFHAGIDAFSGGFVGVDVFFVISGYLITSIILTELQSGQFTLLEFYERRARRIFPALTAVLILCLPLAWVLMTPQDLKQFAQSLSSIVIFSSNFYFWQKSGYFETAAEFKPLLHTWSLSVEEQFYIFFPWLMILFWRWKIKHIGILLIAIIAVGLAISQYAVMQTPSAAFYLLPMRAWELLVGAYVAFRLKTSAAHSTPAYYKNELPAVIGLTMIGFAVFSFDSATPFPGVYAIPPVLGTALVIQYAHSTTKVGQFLSNSFLVGIGLISYSAYLWHQPLFAFSRLAMLSIGSIWTTLTLISLTFILAYITWRYIERPFRNQKWLNRKQIFTWAILSCIGFLIIGVAGNVTKGFVDLKANADQRAIMATARPSPMREKCHTGDNDYLTPAKACEYHEGPLSWAVLGDSHAVELAYALANELKASHQSLKHLSFSGCAPAFGRPWQGSPTPCGQWTREAVEYVAHHPQIRHVVVTYRIHAALHGGHESSYPKIPDSVTASEKSVIWAAYLETLRYLVKSGKKVTLVLQVPELPMSIEKLLFTNALQGDTVTGVPRQWWNARSHWVNAQLAQIPKEITIIDPAGLFCDENICWASKNGVSYYFDDDHPSVAGAQLISREILRQYQLKQSTQKNP
jgi:peptidoglycan/LPS O-acetylase OafA/YrhL